MKPSRNLKTVGRVERREDIKERIIRGRREKERERIFHNLTTKSRRFCPQSHFRSEAIGPEKENNLLKVTQQVRCWD